jgi:hypothetical protein
MQTSLPASSGSDGRTAVTPDRAARAATRARIVTAGLVLALTGSALWLRLYGLQGWDGTLTVDEARLAMAARGVVETGLPRLPSGWIYTRGLLATYLTVLFARAWRQRLRGPAAGRTGGYGPDPGRVRARPRGHGD